MKFRVTGKGIRLTAESASDSNGLLALIEYLAKPSAPTGPEAARAAEKSAHKNGENLAKEVPPECSICRLRHGREVEHASE